tara:strand:+ start:495 stop:1976 length:1482 start_codon:yes stop_codon:yes gene_type:complete
MYMPKKKGVKVWGLLWVLMLALVTFQLWALKVKWPSQNVNLEFVTLSLSLLLFLLLWRSWQVLSLLEKNFTEPISPIYRSVWPLSNLVSSWNNHARRQMRLQEKLISERDDALNEAKGKARFLANMSHEIRTPLNGINGTLHLMRNTDLSKEQLDLVEISEHSSNHLLNVVNMILDYSKLNAGGMQLNEEPLNLEQELRYLLEMFRFKAREKSIRLIYNFRTSEENSPWYFVDSMRLQQVLINLLNNALKFTERGEVTLDVKVEHWHEMDLDRLMFSIKDTGVGIDKDNQDKLFTAFEQGGEEVTRKYGGTGLGLAISQALVQLMGGEIRLVSDKNLGSCFYFTIPLRKAKAPFASKHKRWDEVDLKEEGFNVLVAEDNAVNQQVVKLMLQRLQVAVTIANNGQEALRLFEKEDYDLILMDLQMPVLDGYAATRAIHASPKFHARPLPIIALTASAPDEVKSKVLDAGMDDFIMKPFKPQDLELILKRFSRSI